MQAQRVLVVVGDQTTGEELDTRPEIQAILRAHGREQVNVMYSPTRIDIAEEIGQSDYDILHMAGHCSEIGFKVNKGLLSPSTIASYALSMTPNLKLVVINACSSDEIAKEIGAEANVDVIYTERAVEDSECIEFAILFHTKVRLPTASTFFDAHRMVDPSGKTFKYQYGVSIGSMVRTDHDNERLERIEKNVAEIREYLVGTLQKVGLQSLVGLIAEDVKDHEERLKRLENEAYRATTGRSEPLSDREFFMRLLVIAMIILAIVASAYFIGNWGLR